MRIIDQQHFNDLEIKDQATIASLCGKNLLTIIDGNYKVKLYHLKNYYVQVWIKRKEGNVLYVQTFQDIKFLDPFLRKIKLDLT